jgi:hypothetical protein
MVDIENSYNMLAASLKTVEEYIQKDIRIRIRIRNVE